MRVLVVGGSGFIGINIVRYLAGAGMNVRVAARNPDRVRWLPVTGVEIVKANLNDPASLERAISGCDFVVHAAGYYPIKISNPQKQLEKAVAQMSSFLKAVQHSALQKIIYISSLATLGRPTGDRELVTEDTPYDPSEFPALYHRIKFALEQQVLQASNIGIPATILIPTAVFGPFDHKPTTGRLIVHLLQSKIWFYLDGKMNVVHVQDIAQAVHAAITCKDAVGRFILGNWNTTPQQFYDMVGQIADLQRPMVKIPWAGAMLMAFLSEKIIAPVTRQPVPTLSFTGLHLLKYSHHVSNEKAKRVLGIQFSPVSLAIKEAVDWFRQHGYA